MHVQLINDGPFTVCSRPEATHATCITSTAIAYWAGRKLDGQRT